MINDDFWHKFDDIFMENILFQQTSAPYPKLRATLEVKSFEVALLHNVTTTGRQNLAI